MTKIENEFSRLLETNGITKKAFTYEATTQECAQIAERFHIPALNHFKVQGNIQHLPNGLFQLTALMDAAMTQHDASTNELITQSLHEPILLMLAPSSYTLPEEDLDMDDETPEIVLLKGDGTVDIGEIFVQYLSLAIDPYPRASTAD